MLSIIYNFILPLPESYGVILGKNSLPRKSHWLWKVLIIKYLLHIRYSIRHSTNVIPLKSFQPSPQVLSQSLCYKTGKRAAKEPCLLSWNKRLGPNRSPGLTPAPAPAARHQLQGHWGVCPLRHRGLLQLRKEVPPSYRKDSSESSSSSALGLTSWLKPFNHS